MMYSNIKLDSFEAEFEGADVENQEHQDDDAADCHSLRHQRAFAEALVDLVAFGPAGWAGVGRRCSH